jgi:hypothetical protein
VDVELIVIYKKRDKRKNTALELSKRRRKRKTTEICLQNYGQNLVILIKQQNHHGEIFLTIEIQIDKPKYI